MVLTAVHPPVRCLRPQARLWQVHEPRILPGRLLGTKRQTNNQSINQSTNQPTGVNKNVFQIKSCEEIRQAASRVLIFEVVTVHVYLRYKPCARDAASRPSPRGQVERMLRTVPSVEHQAGPAVRGAVEQQKPGSPPPSVGLRVE